MIKIFFSILIFIFSCQRRELKQIIVHKQPSIEIPVYLNINDINEFLSKPTVKLSLVCGDITKTKKLEKDPTNGSFKNTLYMEFEASFFDHPDTVCTSISLINVDNEVIHGTFVRPNDGVIFNRPPDEDDKNIAIVGWFN